MKRMNVWKLLNLVNSERFELNLTDLVCSQRNCTYSYYKQSICMYINIRIVLEIISVIILDRFINVIEFGI